MLRQARVNQDLHEIKEVEEEKSEDEDSSSKFQSSNQIYQELSKKNSYIVQLKKELSAYQ